MSLAESFLSFSYELAGRMIDPIAGTVAYKSRKSPLRRKQLEVLAILAAAEGELVTRKSFIEQAWDNNALVGDAGLTDTVSDLRHSLVDSDRDRPLIRTIPRRGYQLSALATLLQHAELASFEQGSAIPGKPGWQLQHLLADTELTQTWLAVDQNAGPDDEFAHSHRVFRFCRDEQHLQLLRREAILLRYLREALATRSDIAHINHWQLEEPPYYLELEHFPLGVLPDYAALAGGFSQIAAEQRLRWVAQIARALEAVHEAGITHGNLSADCVFMTQVDGEIRVKLGEFGLGELPDRQRLVEFGITSAGLTLPGNVVSKWGIYLAPERLTGAAATPASDIYALGMLLCQAAGGDLARVPTGWEAQIESTALRQLIAECLKIDPALRPGAAHIVEQLRLLAPEPMRIADAPETSATVEGDSCSVLSRCALLKDSVSEVAPDQPRPSPIAQYAVDKPAAVDKSDAPDKPYTPRQTKLQAQKGEMIGPYRVLEKLGQGGMGVVYLAEQRQPVQRQVALKVILAGMDTEAVLARFEAERQALALMNHANVAAVFDAGSSQVGRPYFAMEYVSGADIATHCDQHQLDVPSRIKLFIQVCSGVLHAHQKGIIHRDLKPSNLLIKTAQGQSAVVKIIDFGVAKSLQRKLSDLSAHTQLGSFVGTPIYSSPEQISANVCAVDSRTDIYSLGIVLYQLLSGVTPYSEDKLGVQSPVELTQFFNSQDPPTLLKRFASLDPKLEADIAARRKLTVHQLKELISYDLSWIVGKCLERDPNERYASVLELEKDLNRWLENRPVEARPITWRYRARKMVRRNWKTVVAGSAVTLALLITSTAAVVGYVRTQQALVKADLAGRESELAAQFQMRLIENLDTVKMGEWLKTQLLIQPSSLAAQATRQTSAPTTVTAATPNFPGLNFPGLVREMVQIHYFAPAFDIIERDYQNQPALQATLWQALADSSAELNLWPPALKAQNLALDRRVALFGEYSLPVLQSRKARAFIHSDLGNATQAKVDMKSAVDGYQKLYGPQSTEALAALIEYAGILDGLWDTETYAVTQQAIALSQKINIHDADQAVNLQIRLAGGLTINGKYDEAIETLKSAQEFAKAKLPIDHNSPERITQELGLNYGFVDNDLALLHSKQALDIRVRKLGYGDPKTAIATSFHARFLAVSGKPEVCEALVKAALDQQNAQIRHAAFFELKAELARCLMTQSRFNQAEKLLFEINRDKKTHWLSPGFETELLGGLLIERGQYRQAEGLLREYWLSQSENFSLLGKTYLESLIAQALSFDGRHQEAETLQSNLVSTLLRSYGETDPNYLDRSSELAEMLHRQQRNPEAQAILEKTLAIQKVGSPVQKMGAQATARRLADVFLDAGEPAKAFALSQSALQATRGFIYKDDPTLIGYLNSYLMSALAVGQTSDVSKTLNEAIAIAQKAGVLDGHYGKMLRKSCARAIEARLQEVSVACAGLGS